MHPQTLLLIMLLHVAIAWAEEPSISLSISNCLEGEQVPVGICAIANNQRIELELLFNRKGNVGFPRLAETPVNPESTNGLSNFVLLRAIEDQSGTAIPVSAIVSGSTVMGYEEALNITMEIQEDAATRTNKIQAFIDQTKANGLASGEASQAFVDLLTQENAATVSALSKIYTANRIGLFRIRAEYYFTQQEPSQVISPEIIIDIKNKGSFFP